MSKYKGRVFLVCLVSILIPKPVQNQSMNIQTQSSDLCKDTRCSSPPTTYECTVTSSDNPKIIQRLGPLKDCCPIYFCVNETDSNDKFLFVGLDQNHSNRTGDSKNCETTTSCPKIPKYEGTCETEPNPDNVIKEFAKGAISCCPVLNCTTKKDGTFIRFSTMDGSLPPSNKIEEDAKPCEKFTCPSNPEILDSVCYVHQSADTQIADSLGKLKDCCPTWECSYPDGSTYLHFTIQGNDFRYKEIRTRLNSTSSKTSSAKSRKDKCKSGETCPMLKKDSCSYKSSEEDTEKFIPEKEKCCPLMRCRDKNGKTRTHYVKISGTVPEAEKNIANEKGSKKKCSMITCEEKSKMRKQNDCYSHGAGMPLFSEVEAFSSCCDMIKCYRSDGSYSRELSLHSPSFSYYEISFYDIPHSDVSNRIALKQANTLGQFTVLEWLPQLIQSGKKF